MPDASGILELSPEELAGLRHEIEEASEPVAQFWPMKTFVHHNPIHGLEHMPFDRAIREGKALIGGSGYLPNHEYRQLYQAGRITARSVERALGRVGPRVSPPSVTTGAREITAQEVLRLHLLFGFEALEPRSLPWALGGGGALERFRHDLPSETRSTLLRERPEPRYLEELLSAALAVLALADPRSEAEADAPHASGASERPRLVVDLPHHRTLGDWVGHLADFRLVEAVDDQMIKWIAAFVDEGMAGWSMPSRQSGFYAAWRLLARHDASGHLLGIRELTRKLDELPGEPEEAIARALRRLEIPEARWRDYLSRLLAQLPGWAGFIRWRGQNPDYPAQESHPIDPIHYLAVRLFYEVELTGVVSRRQWGVDATLPALVSYWEANPVAYERKLRGGAAADSDGANVAEARDGFRLFHLAQFLALSPEALRGLARADADTTLSWLDAFPSEMHGPVWLEAYEDVYRDDLLSKLSMHRGKSADRHERPRAQAVFCIDVRSESFRRHLEDQGPYETYGFAGFFGVAISHRIFDKEASVALCPVLLTPKHAVSEIPRAGQGGPLQRYASGTRWQKLSHQLFHDLKHNPIASFVLIDLLGLFFSLGLIGKTIVQRPFESAKAVVRRFFAHPVATEVPVAAAAKEDPAGLSFGFTLEEQATFVENGLRTMGLTKNFGRFVLLCGHGGLSDNNPYFAALACGACGGNPGDPNARVFTAMGNNPEVRRLLAERGLAIPEDTWFLAGKHNTNTDRVTLYDVQDVPSSHAEDLRVFRRDLERGGAEQALERCHRIPGAPRSVTVERAYAHVEGRSFDWANPRPEWGLAGNASFIVGRRSLTRGLSLSGRAFLHSYDPEPDAEGAILEKIMTAPLIVGEWINMEHYFSGVDPWSYGSGSKVIHNVVSGIGLMLGSQSDLQTGLPLQTVNDGAVHHHEPMRLLTIIEADKEIIGAIIRKHEILQTLFHNEWVNLVALDPQSFAFHRYNADATWEPWEPIDVRGEKPA